MHLLICTPVSRLSRTMWIILIALSHHDVLKNFSFLSFFYLKDFDTSQIFVLRADNPMTVNVEMSTVRVSAFLFCVLNVLRDTQIYQMPSLKSHEHQHYLIFLNFTCRVQLVIQVVLLLILFSVMKVVS